MPEVDGTVIVSMQERSLTAKIDRQLTHRGAARSVGAMAAMLAHEVKTCWPASAARRSYWSRVFGPKTSPSLV